MSFPWRHQYDAARDRAEGDKARTLNELPSRTQVSFANDADINVLMQRFGVKDGALEPAALDPRFYGDFSDVPDFRQALETTRTAQATFDTLPAKIKNRFANDPVRLWEFVNDQDNHEEAVTLGLLHKRVLGEGKGPADPPVSPPA